MIFATKQVKVVGHSCQKGIPMHQFRFPSINLDIQIEDRQYLAMFLRRNQLSIDLLWLHHWLVKYFIEVEQAPANRSLFRKRKPFVVQIDDNVLVNAFKHLEF